MRTPKIFPRSEFPRGVGAWFLDTDGTPYEVVWATPLHIVAVEGEFPRFAARVCETASAENKHEHA